MSSRINTNGLANSAARYNAINQDKVASSIEKLSSGLRINRAADDAAGLVISEGLRAQVSGLDQAIRNSNEAANMIKTAEGALNEVHDLLRSMRTLAVHAANTGANDSNSIAADQAQIKNALKSLDRIASSTSFGNLKLLDGTASTSVASNSVNASNASAAGSTVRGTYGIKVTTAGVKGSADATAFTFARTEGDTGVNAAFTALAAGSTVSFTDANATHGINETVSVDLAGATSLQDVVNRVNSNATAGKYVKASIYNDGTDNFLRFDSLAVNGTAGDFSVNFGDTGDGTTVATALGYTAAAQNTGTDATDGFPGLDFKVGQDVSYTVTQTGRDGNTLAPKTFSIAAGTKISDVISSFDKFAKANSVESHLEYNTVSGVLTVKANDVGTNRGATLATASGTDSLGLNTLDSNTNATDMVVQINGNNVASVDVDGSKVSVSAGSGPSLKDSVGLSFVMTSAETANSVASLTVGGNALNFQIGANAGDLVSIEIKSTSTNQIGNGVIDGKSLSDLDVTTAEGAANALKMIDGAIAQISTQRADLGAFQSQVLESNIRSLGVAKENVAASESTIRDTDMAMEMVNFTKNNILSQASQAMLSQANNANQGILQLLRG